MKLWTTCDGELPSLSIFFFNHPLLKKCFSPTNHVQEGCQTILGLGTWFVGSLREAAWSGFMKLVNQNFQTFHLVSEANNTNHFHLEVGWSRIGKRVIQTIRFAKWVIQMTCFLNYDNSASWRQILIAQIFVCLHPSSMTKNVLCSLSELWKKC